MLEKSPPLICAGKVFQFVKQSSRKFGLLWIIWTFAKIVSRNTIFWCL